MSGLLIFVILCVTTDCTPLKFTCQSAATLTCSRVLNLRDVSSFFLSVSSNRLAYSKICFCCSAIFPLQLRRSRRIRVSWLLYLGKHIHLCLTSIYIFIHLTFSPSLNHLLSKATVQAMQASSAYFITTDL